MGLTKAVVLGRGSPLSQHERQVLDRLAEVLPDDYRIWSGLTLFAPRGKAYEIDAIVLGHHGLYILEVKKQIAKIDISKELDRLTSLKYGLMEALVQNLDVPPALETAWRLGGMSAAIDFNEASPFVETLLAVPDDVADAIRGDSHVARVVKQADLPKILLTGGLPGTKETRARAPLEEDVRIELARFFEGLRHRVRPDRGNVFHELRHLHLDLVADMRARADVMQGEEAAALWLIALVFVRILEANGYVDRERLAGQGALEAERAYFDQFPGHGHHDYLRYIVEQLPIIASLDELKRMSPSAEGARAALEFFRRDDVIARQWQANPYEDRLWSELYTLGEELVKQHAMVQTPRFVGEFLLERTVTPAMETFGANGVTVLDLACGMGNLVVAAFEKLCAAGLSPNEALDRVYGVDISPIATTISRMRLLLAYMDRIRLKSIAELPNLPNHIETADAVLRSGDFQISFDERLDDDSMDSRGNETSFLKQRFSVIVCDPPYVTEKDPARREVYRKLYRSASGHFSLVAPFVERAFQLASPDGYVGMLVSSAFSKREFGKPLVQDVLPHYELTHVIDSSGVYVLGHSTPTLMLFGRNRQSTTTSIRVVAGKNGEPIVPVKPEKGLVWLSITAHWDELGYEDDYISVADVPRETLSHHPWIFGSHAVEVLLDRLRREQQTLSTLALRIHVGSQSGFDALFSLPAHVTRRLSFEPNVLRPYLQAPWIRDFGVHAEYVALAPYRLEDETVLSPAGNEEWLKFLWKYRTVLRANAKKWFSKSGPWWKWQRWFESANVTHRIVCPGVAWYNHFALVHERMATAPTICVIDLPRAFARDDALALLGWLNSSTACFWFRRVGATLKENILFLNASLLESMPIPTNLVHPGPIRDRVIALAKQLDELARSLEDQYAPRRVLERWDGSSQNRLMELLGEAQMRDQSARLKMVCRQEDLDWVIYEALGLIADAGEPIASSASPDERPFAWLTDTWPRGLQRALVDVWQRRRRALRADPLLAILETAPYKRRFDDVDESISNEDDVDDLPVRRRARKKAIDYWERTAKACEDWMLERIEQVFRESPVSLLSQEELMNKLEASVAPGIVASVWGSRRSRVTTLAEMLGELLLEEALPALVSERHTASGLGKRAEWRKIWELQRREDAGEEIPEIPVLQPFARDDYRDAVSYRLRGAWDVPTERIWVHRDERSDELRYCWAGWTDEQKAAVFSGMGEV